MGENQGNSLFLAPLQQIVHSVHGGAVHRRDTSHTKNQAGSALPGHNPADFVGSSEKQRAADLIDIDMGRELS